MITGTPKGLLQALDLVTASPDASLRSLGETRAGVLRRLRAIAQNRNIVGVGISEKTTDSETTGELSLCFYVRKKTPLKAVRGDLVVPPFICTSGERGYVTDIKEIGACRLHEGTGSGLRCGGSVSHAVNAAGTIGAIVRRAGKLCILSNAHVLARSGKAKLGDPIISPGTTDGGRAATDQVARLVAFVPLDGFGENVVDAAVAEILPGKLGSVAFDVPGMELPARTIKAQRGMEVTKTGKETHGTTAHVIDHHFRALLPYPNGLGLVRFVDQILCTSFASPGDSGSLVIDADTGRVVGLHFAGNDTVSICNPIEPVLQALQLSFAN